MLNVLKRHGLWVVFAAMVIAQLGFPISSIVGMNDVLKSGTEFKIKTRLVDPADPFRGRYVAIGVELDIPEPLQGEVQYGRDAFIRLRQGADGFAEVVEVSGAPLAGDGVLHLNDVFGRGETIRLPYDRYYMQESIAPKAEAVYNRERENAFVTIRVKNGVGAVSGLYINDTRIEDIEY